MHATLRATRHSRVRDTPCPPAACCMPPHKFSSSHVPTTATRTLPARCTVSLFHPFSWFLPAAAHPTATPHILKFPYALKNNRPLARVGPTRLLRRLRGTKTLNSFWGYGVLVSVVLAVFYLLAMDEKRVVMQQMLLVALAAYTDWILVAIWRCAKGSPNGKRSSAT